MTKTELKGELRRVLKAVLKSLDEPEELPKWENMTKKELKEKLKQAYETDPDYPEYKGSILIGKSLGIPPDSLDRPQYWGVHGVLLELEKEGFLERKKGKGFRWRQKPCCQESKKQVAQDIFSDILSVLERYKSNDTTAQKRK